MTLPITKAELGALLNWTPPRDWATGLLGYPTTPFSAAGGFMSVDNERRFTESNMWNVLQARMGWNVNAPQNPFRKVQPFKLNDEKIAVFVVHGDKALIIEDEVGLYPSDALVTQLRLLAEAP